MRLSFRRCFAAMLVLAATLAFASEPRLVAVGDVHGDLNGLVSILQESNLIGPDRHWTGGNAVLVQTGDLLDRGPQGREVLELMMSLEAEAPRSGGRVVVLLGNHEVMNLMGDLRYVSPQGFAEFASPKSEKLRKSAYNDYLRWNQDRKKAGAPVEPGVSQETWMAEHPAGYFEHRQVFAPNGKYGKWLRQRPAAVVIGNTAFVHGGFGPYVAAMTIAEIDGKVHGELAAFDRDTRELSDARITLPFLRWEELSAALNAEIHRRIAANEKSGDSVAAALAELSQTSKWLSVSPDGPLWYRGYDRLSDEQAAELVGPFLKANRIEHVVAGHTPQAEGQIRPRNSGSIFEIDTGMLSSYFVGGQPAALEIKDGTFTAIYKNRRAVLLPAPKSSSAAEASSDEHHNGGGAGEDKPAAPYLTFHFIGPDGKTLPFTSDEEILDFMKTAEVVESKNTATGVNETRKLTLEKNGLRVHAVFRLVDLEKPVGGAGAVTDPTFRDSYIMEPPAYLLSKYLGIPYVPPAVLRTLQGKNGSLQLWIENAMDEEKRKKTGAAPPDPSRWNHYIHTMHVWDNLVCNTDRNLGNILIDPQWNVWYIDHTRAFWRHHDMIHPEQIQKVERHLWEKIQAMNEAEVRPMLSPYLRKEEIDALFKRKQTFINYVQKLIRQKGENNVLYMYMPPVIEMYPNK